MRSAEFVAIVSACCPTSAELGKAGISIIDEDGIFELWRFGRREPRSHPPGTSELEKLITDYDCSTVGVGGVNFLAAPRPHKHGVEVALEEADPVVVRADGSVAVYQFAYDDYVIFECAVDSEHFLAAVARSAQIVRSAEKPSWLGRGEEAVAECAALAGGAQYSQLFQGLGQNLNRKREVPGQGGRGR